MSYNKNQTRNNLNTIPELFIINVPVISNHLTIIFEETGLKQMETVKNAIRRLTTHIKGFYNRAKIITVGYYVNSDQTPHFNTKGCTK